MTNQEVAQRFASGTGTSGTNPAKSLYWSHDTIYSYGYHHVIAHINRADKTAVVSRYKASVTTSKQTTLVVSELLKAGYTITYEPVIPSSWTEGCFRYSLPH